MARRYCYHPTADEDLAPISLWVGGTQLGRLIQLKWPQAVPLAKDRRMFMFGARVQQFSARGTHTSAWLFDLRPLPLPDRLALIRWLDEREALYDYDRQEPEVHRAKALQYAS